MKTYEQLRYIYLSNIACGDISEADQAVMLAELEGMKTSMHKADLKLRVKEPAQSCDLSKNKVAA